MANAQPQSQAGPAPVAQEFTVRVPKKSQKRYSIIKFNAANNVDFTKSGSSKIERENNYREYKNANDVDQQPKFGAGSEFGREQKEEARRKRYGIVMRHYDPEKQPWLLKMGTGKQARKFKGVRDGGINDNASYYVFTQCPDGAFEAFPVESWYSFNPVIKYKYLNADEAEEEYSRRDKTLNYFNIMLRKRMKNEEVDEDEEEGKNKEKKEKKKKKDFMLTEMDDWVQISDDEEDEDQDDDADDEEGSKKKSEKNKKGPVKKKKNARHNSDEEAIEDSDDGENEGREVDYMTSSSSDEEEVVKSKYADKGVEDEDGLRKLMESGDEEEEEEKEDKNKEEEDVEAENKTKKEERSKKESDSDSSGSSSDSDSEDPEAEPNFASALFMQKKKKDKDKLSPSKASENNSDSSRNSSRPSTPVAGQDADKKGKKRKVEAENPLTKRAKTEPTLTHSASSSSLTGGAFEGVNEESVRRYLLRKPMTTKDLLQKFRSKKTGLTNEQLVHTLGQILKKLNPEKKTINDKMYLFIKKTE